ncbi:Metallo-dependent phosphatase [Daldinia decipiens]|uniref:Metallo-dependent phosphatase n=1 Tax=Daldinia decipiens TaxID=326647 RepID=UPI0020C370CD|nr:Metallo-dependent phosphatase [Daldinia decipiens]KAI1662448.1 Metallo-dependent phosphatase [Daldinia decipiens]
MGRPEPLPSRPQRRRITTASTIFTILLITLLCFTRYSQQLLPIVPAIMTQDAQSQSQSQPHPHPHPSFTKPTLLASLPPSALPKPHAGLDSPRLIMIGDVHGQLDALDALLTKVGYSRARGDTVVFTGDMVNKGPDSGGVVDRAVEMGAYSVRGNHEDRVLRAWAEMQADANTDTDTDTDTDIDEEAGGDAEAEGKKRKKNHGHKHKHKSKKGDRKTAKSLTSAQRSWLAARPVILRVGAISPYYGDVVVVHGGLVPGIALEKQDPQVVMNIRTLITPSSSSSSTESLLDPSIASSSHPHLKPSEGREGHPWSKVWNTLEKEKRKKGRHGTPTTTVIYGHDAKTGLSIRRYAFGLDSNCARGGELTALVFEPTSPSTTDSDSDSPDSSNDSNNGENTEITASEKLEQTKHGIAHRIVSVACRPR